MMGKLGKKRLPVSGFYFNVRLSSVGVLSRMYDAEILSIAFSSIFGVGPDGFGNVSPLPI